MVLTRVTIYGYLQLQMNKEYNGVLTTTMCFRLPHIFSSTDTWSDRLSKLKNLLSEFSSNTLGDISLRKVPWRIYIYIYIYFLRRIKLNAGLEGQSVLPARAEELGFFSNIVM